MIKAHNNDLKNALIKTLEAKLTKNQLREKYILFLYFFPLSLFGLIKKAILLN